MPIPFHLRALPLIMMWGLVSCGEKRQKVEQASQVVFERTQAIQNERSNCNRQVLMILDELRKSDSVDAFILSRLNAIEFLLKELRKVEDSELRVINRALVDMQ